ALDRHARQLPAGRRIALQDAARQCTDQPDSRPALPGHDDTRALARITPALPQAAVMKPHTVHDKRHWADQPERGNLLFMRFTAWTARRLGRRVVAPVVWLAVLYFYLFGGQARRSIAQYQARLQAATPDTRLFPGRSTVYRQYLAFAH